MTSINQYPKMGSYSIIPAADLIDIDSAANVKSPARLGDAGMGKTAGAVVIRDSGTGDKYSMVFATGDSAASVWLAADGATKYTPV